IKSGLRGRGGGGFPTGIKWQSAQKAAARKNEKPCLVCNAYGSFKDSSIVETDPHAVIEGMTICALAVGASEGFIYINRESSLALARMTTAVTQAKEKGFLGREKTASGLSFDINIHRGADAFISGESSAMLAAISGKAGEPSAKYIHSAESGYHNRPTIVDNVETWANIPSIIEKGSSWFAGIGKGSTGTKIITLTGKIINYGLIEIEMGTSLREIIYDIGGGIGGNGNLKAVQVGGPSGGFLPASLLDIPVDFDSLTKAGSMMGTGSIVVMDDTTCMVNLVKNAISFLKGESCGKCTPCREGLIAINEMLDRITRGEGREGDVELMTEIAEVMKNASLCAFGKTAANPVLSTIKYFRDEYNTHIKDNKCNAGVCRELITYSVNDNCTGCTICAENCPVDAIRGIPKQKHSIDTKLCIKCGICSEVCKFAAITVQ
ncbi:MAG: 4Fe-4S binding protein, partial [Candidatus Cloacimonetes bacterium]|nr:4Fe-4S binding protein [Candidatus Cloacimonadota bacterium]